MHNGAGRDDSNLSVESDLCLDEIIQRAIYGPSEKCYPKKSRFCLNATLIGAWNGEVQCRRFLPSSLFRALQVPVGVGGGRAARREEEGKGRAYSLSWPTR